MFKDNYKYCFSLEKYLKAIGNAKVTELKEEERMWTSYCEGREVEPISNKMGIIYLPDGVHHILIEFNWCTEESRIKKLILK